LNSVGLAFKIELLYHALSRGYNSLLNDGAKLHHVSFFLDLKSKAITVAKVYQLALLLIVLRQDRSDDNYRWTAE
jgi:hypothetical protein